MFKHQLPCFGGRVRASAASETRLIASVAGLILTGAVFVAHAAPPKAWKEEPTAFLGIGLDTNFPGGMQECPTRGAGGLRYVDPFDGARMATTCVGPAFQNMYQIYGSPKLGFGYELNAFTYDGKAGLFLLTSNVANYAAMKELLIARYGAPSKKQSLSVTTKGGGKFTSEQLTWSGKKVSIVLDQLSSDINTSSISVKSTSYAESQQKQAGDKARANASKL